MRPESFVRGALLLVIAGCGGSTGQKTGGTAPAPRLIAPLSTATVTSRRPTFRWELSADTDGARVQICRDRACEQEVTTLDTLGVTAAPDGALPTGVLFWRAYGRSNGVIGQAASPTWQFTVGAWTAPTSTSWGTTLDVNGDGYADVLVGAPNANTFAGGAYVYLGSAAGLTTTPSTTLFGAEPQSGFGVSVASAGDVNGDGYADVIVGAVGGPPVPGWAYVYLGGETGLTATPAATLVGPDGPGGGFGHSVASAGDVNGDGYADVVVGGPKTVGETGRAYLYLGSPSGIAATPSLTLTGPDGPIGHFGHQLRGAGDVNGDGYGDIAVGASAIDGNTGRAYLYLGGATGLAADPVATLVGPDGPGGYFGYDIAGAGDVNGDGRADVIVGANSADQGDGRAYLYLGSPDGLTASPITVDAPDPASYFGSAVASAGDVNSDGYADIVVGAITFNSQIGRAYLFLGGAAGLATLPAFTFDSPDGAAGHFGIAVASAGDVSGDGYVDVVIGGAIDGRGGAYLYEGDATGLPTVPTDTLSDPGTMGGFGASVALVRALDSGDQER